jgi:ubiquinone/menaquinone biosynthesis C-methylase UbiE
MNLYDMFEYLNRRMPIQQIPITWDDTGYTSVSFNAWANDPSFSGWQDEHDTEKQTAVIAKLLNIQRGETLLDVCCGYGRHSLTFAEKYGLTVTGIDVSPGLINAAKRFAVEKKLNITFEKKHAAELSGKSVFNIVIIADNSLSLIAPDKAPLVLKKIHKALKNGGRLLLDLDNKPYNCRHGNYITHWHKYTGGLVLQEIYFHEDTSVEVCCDIDFKKDAEAADEFIMFKRIYTQNEIKKLLADNGFKVTGVFGGWDLETLEEKSPKMILIGIKK